jgi:hypothetical protein
MIHISDNFFHDPYFIRNIALKQKYKTEKFNYPGVRSFDVPKEVQEYILWYVKHITRDPLLVPHCISFQSVTQEFGEGIFHFDPHKYICIVYLSLDAPMDSGTEVCAEDQVADPCNTEEIVRRKADAHKDPKNLIKRYRYDRIKKKVNSHYKPIVKVPHKFNRAVFFPATHFHRAQKFFGTSLENGRLTIVSFLV